jgi:hypothetical protein
LLSDSIAQRRAQRRTHVEGAQHSDRGDRLSRKFWRNIVVDAGQAKDLNGQRLAGPFYGFKVSAGEAPQTQFEPMARDRLLDRFALTFELGANGGADEVRAIGVKSFLDQEIDLSEVDEAKIDCDLFAVDRFCSEFCNLMH